MTKRVEIKVLHCSACGAPIADRARRCDHCSAPISLRQRDLDRVCRDCGARMAGDARYCAGCGAATPEQAVTPLPANQACPRCEGGLERRDFATDQGGTTLVECAACAGLWVAPAVFDHLCRRVEAAAAAWRGLLASKSRRPAFVEGAAVRYLPCPDCGERMNRRNWGGEAGVVVDWCKPHGLWFDHDEFAFVLDHLRGGGAEVRARRDAGERAADALLRRERTRARREALRPLLRRDGLDVAVDLAAAVQTFVTGICKALFPRSRRPPSVILRRAPPRGRTR